MASSSAFDHNQNQLSSVRLWRNCLFRIKMGKAFFGDEKMNVFETEFVVLIIKKRTKIAKCFWIRIQWDSNRGVSKRWTPEHCFIIQQKSLLCTIEMKYSTKSIGPEHNADDFYLFDGETMFALIAVHFMCSLKMEMLVKNWQEHRHNTKHKWHMDIGYCKRTTLTQL